jgi:hypothetical protein
MLRWGPPTRIAHITCGLKVSVAPCGDFPHCNEKNGSSLSIVRRDPTKSDPS